MIVISTRDVEAEAEAGSGSCGSGTFSVEAEAEAGGFFSYYVKSELKNSES